MTSTVRVKRASADEVLMMIIMIFSLQVLGLQNYVLYGHGPDLCHDMEFKHALANCMESLMGTYNVAMPLVRRLYL